MRTELEKIKYIEDYLTGKLPVDEVKNFEQEITNNPELAKEVEIQNQIIKRANRAAMKEQFEALHQANFSSSTAKKWWQKNIWLNVFFLFFLIGAITGIYNFNSSENPTVAENSIVSQEVPQIADSTSNIESLKESDSDSDSISESYDYECEESTKVEYSDAQLAMKTNQINELDDKEEVDEITPEKIITKINNEPTVVNDTIIRDSSFNLSIEDFLPVFDTLTYIPTEGLVYQYKRSGTEIRLPKNLIDGKENSSEPVQLLYREYRNQADIAFSGIPMHYTQNDTTYEFESGGMFEFKPAQEGLKMNPIAQKDVELNFVLTNSNIDLDYYELENEKWVKKAKIIENPDRTKLKNRRPPRLKCEEEKICKFMVTKAQMDEILLAEKGRRNPITNNNPYPSDIISTGIKSLFNYLKKRREKRKGIEPKKEEYKDVYGNMEFEILIPNKSYRKRANVNVHIEEALVYQKEPLRCYEVKELLYSILDKNCNTCRHEIHIADSANLAELKKTLFKLDSLNQKVEERNNKNTEDEKLLVIEEVFDKNLLMPEYYLSTDKKFVNVRSVNFGISNCDALRRINSDNPFIVRSHFYDKNNELIKDVPKVSVIPLNFNSASSYPLGSIQVSELPFRTLFIFSKNGLYYINNKKLKELAIGEGSRSNLAEKLPRSIHTSQALMEFIDKERKALINN